MRIAGLVQDSIVDGPGLRFSVFTQGCTHACPGCHNPETHDMTGGNEMSVSDVIKKMESNPLTDGVTLTGGDPFCQASDCADIAEAAHSLGLNVWTYTGYTFEQVKTIAETDGGFARLLKATDVMVGGPFVLEKRTLSLRWRGSTNQRLIDVKKSLETGDTVLAE